MIIQCDKCNTRFRLDDSRIGNGIKVRCTKCQNVFIVAPPAEEAQIEEILTPVKAHEPALKASFDSASRLAEDKPKARPSGRSKILDNETLAFNFERPQAGSEEDTFNAPGERSSAPNASFEEPDPLKSGRLGSTTETPEDKKTPARTGSHFDELDFSFGDEKEEGGKSSLSGEETGSLSDEWKIGSVNKGGGLDEKDHGVPGKDENWKIAGVNEDDSWETPPKTSLEAPAPQPPPSSGKPAPAADETPSSQGYKRDGRAYAGKFEDILLDSIKDGYSHKDFDLEKDFPVPPPVPRKKGYYAIAAVIAIFIAAAVYIAGGVDVMTRKILVPRPAGERERPVRIDTVRGFFANNKNIGRVFVIEAWIKNTSDTPQDVKEIRGVLYNKNGEKIKVLAVSPGRVVSLDDIKNFSKDDLLKQYRNISGGTIPPRGAVPVTIVFTEVPKDMAEFGVDIVRKPT